MPLKAVIEKVEDAPEALRSAYRPGTADEGTDGKFVLDVEPSDGFTLENVDGLKTALSKERRSRETAEKAVEAFKDMDASDIQKKLEKLADLEKLDPSKEADKIAQQKIDAAREQLVQQHEQALNAERERAAKYEAGYKTRTMESAVNEALASADAINPEALALKLRSHFRLKETGNADDPFAVEVVDGSGNPMIGNAKGDPMNPKGLMEQLRSDPKWATSFKPAGKSGSDARQSSGGAKTMTRAQFDQLEPGDRGEVIKSGISITD
ncbi:hypothetical protein ACSMXM_05510 [Pacificimonas sp. ICDLI1SI03]